MSFRATRKVRSEPVRQPQGTSRTPPMLDGWILVAVNRAGWNRGHRRS